MNEKPEEWNQPEDKHSIVNDVSASPERRARPKLPCLAVFGSNPVYRLSNGYRSS